MSYIFFVLQTNFQYFDILLSLILQNPIDMGLMFNQHLIFFLKSRNQHRL